MGVRFLISDYRLTIGGRGTRLGTMAAALIALAPLPAQAWLAGGHERITDLAVTLAAKELPAFFAAGRLQIIHNSVDPDLFCERAQVPELASTERPDHYLDWELMESHVLPTNRSERPSKLGGRLAQAPLHPSRAKFQTSPPPGGGRRGRAR